jgi:Domain of unknown function (DUF4157)
MSAQRQSLLRAAQPGPQLKRGEARHCDAWNMRHQPLQRRADGPRPSGAWHDGVIETLRAPGAPLDPATDAELSARFGHDFSAVRVHTNDRAANSARALNAAAYTAGHDVVFDAGQYDPSTAAGRELLGHELAHVVQQRGGTTGITAHAAQLEQQADQAASAVVGSGPMPSLSAAGPALQRRVSVRDVGRGEQSGMGRIGEFVARLNEVSTGLDFRFEAGWLLADLRAEGVLSEFDRHMQDFIGDTSDIPMRMTNRHGLLGDRTMGYHWGIELDTWQSGYVDIDDMLRSSPSGFMTSLVHLLRERQRTANYSRRIGTASLDASQPGPAAEFRRVHGAGLDAELAVLRDYLQDPSLRFIDRGTRLLRNDRGDRITERLASGAGGNHASRWVVTLRGTRRVISLEEYRELLDRERIAAQIGRERLGGATEHRAPGVGVPAP